MSDASFNFLARIPDQCGFLVISEGAVIKSDGDLSNKERTADIAERMVNIARSDSLPNAKFQQLTVHFGSHFFTVVQSGKYVYVVKRRVPAA